MQTDWLKKPCNLVLIGPSGVGKSHVASAICYDAVTKGKQTVFLTLFDLTAKLTKARSVYNLIDYYAKIPVLCVDEIGYVMPTREQADQLFQIVSKRVETGTTIVTHESRPLPVGQGLRLGDRLRHTRQAQHERHVPHLRGEVLSEQKRHERRVGGPIAKKDTKASRQRQKVRPPP